MSGTGSTDVRRRLLLAILGTVALSLVLSGTGTYLLLRREAIRTTETSLRVEAESLVGLLDLANGSPNPAVGQQKIIKGLRLEGISVLTIGPGGVQRGELPEGVTADEVNPSTMVPGTTISGQRRQLLWAASTVQGPKGAILTVVITRDATPARAPLGWFLVAGAVALAVGAAVAAWLSDTLTRPLRHAQEATVRIAAGDLTAPLPEPPPTETDEVADLARAINQMAAQLAHSRGLERQFLMSVSHDLRTPLTSIRGYADAITDGTAAEPVDAARVISAEAQRLTRLVGDLLDLARLDAHEFSFQFQAMAVSDVATDVAEGLRPAAEEAGVELVVVEAPTVVASWVDPDRLAQAVANLVENGLKFARSRLWVETQVGAQGDVVVRVTDDGPGIAPHEVAHVFERLYVADRRPHRMVGGSGLGLAIVRQLVDGMGGRAWVESPALADGTGARMVIALPPMPSTPAV